MLPREATGTATKAMLALLSLASLLAPSLAIDVSFGDCPHKQVVQNFNVTRYMGLWYELERFWQIYELNGKCSQAVYTLDTNTGKVKVKNTMTDERSLEEKSIEGTAELLDPDHVPLEGKLTVTFNIPVIGERKAPYWVLDTDYNTYAIVYSCSKVLGFVKTESAWILARTPTVADDVQQQIEAAVKKAAVNRGSFLKTRQDC